MFNNPDVDLVNMDAYMKFGEILSICSQDIEGKRNFGVKIKGHNTGTNMRKMTANNSNIDLVSINSYVLFGQNLFLRN